MLQKFHTNQKGFTLIELLVVIAIIGILAAIAIPQFASYRRNAYCSKVESDVNNTMLAMEAYYASKSAYTVDLALLGVTASKDVSLAPVAGAPGVPVSVVGTDTSAECPKGPNYTLTQGSQPAWDNP